MPEILSQKLYTRVAPKLSQTRTRIPNSLQAVETTDSPLPYKTNVALHSAIDTKKEYGMVPLRAR